MTLPEVANWLPAIMIGIGFIAVMAAIGRALLIHTEREIQHILYGPLRKEEYFNRSE